MSSPGGYFSTDWQAMTLTDYIGIGLSVLLTVLMVWVYVYSLRPKNKERLNAHSNIPLDDDQNTDKKD